MTCAEVTAIARDATRHALPNRLLSSAHGCIGGWSYFVPYEADLQAALRGLRARVTQSGDYYKGSDEDGTHSILDISKASSTPVPARMDLDFGVVAPLPDGELVALFGTARPTRAMVDAQVAALQARRRRWTGTCVVIYDADQPTELFFTGFSGD